MRLNQTISNSGNRFGKTGILSFLIFTAWLFAAALLHAGPLNKAQLADTLDNLVSSSGLGGGKVSVAVYDPRDSTEIYAHRASVPMIPASLQKIHTAIAALRFWGPAHTFKTPVGYRGVIKDSLLIGDLVVRASGDPSWIEEIYPAGPHLVFESWADSLRVRGIKQIEGNLLVDVSLFPAVEYNPTWDREDWPNAYAPSVSPFSFNGNMVRWDLKGSSAAGSRPAAELKFGYDYFKWQNKTQTSSAKGEASLWLSMSPDKRSVTLNGNLGPNTEDYLKAAVRDPEQFALQMLVSTFQKKGISIMGKAVADSDSVTTMTTAPLFEHRSPSLYQLLAVMLKNSSGFISETLLADLGPGGAAGAKRIMELYAASGMGGSAFEVVDGSGLSRQNKDSASHFCRTLCYAYNQNWFIYFFGALAVPGETGTLERRFNSNEAKESIFAKTGTMTGVSNLGGYVRAADGELYAFAVFANGIGSIAQAKKLQESVCSALARYSGE